MAFVLELATVCSAADTVGETSDDDDPLQAAATNAVVIRAAKIRTMRSGEPVPVENPSPVQPVERQRGVSRSGG